VNRPIVKSRKKYYKVNRTAGKMSGDFAEEGTIGLGPLRSADPFPPAVVLVGLTETEGIPYRVETQPHCRWNIR
jgi:hypothetical protein